MFMVKLGCTLVTNANFNYNFAIDQNYKDLNFSEIDTDLFFEIQNLILVT